MLTTLNYLFIKLIENAKRLRENELIAKREKLILEIEKESRRMEEFREFAELDRMQQVRHIVRGATVANHRLAQADKHTLKCRENMHLACQMKVGLIIEPDIYVYCHTMCITIACSSP